MAKMVPHRLTERLKKQNSQAEIKLYQFLQSCLPDSWTVYYNMEYNLPEAEQNLSPGAQSCYAGQRRDGEADFILWHERYGLLVLEVKGGIQIRYEGKYKRWKAQRHDLNWVEIKDPFEQAKKTKYRLLDQFRHQGITGFALVHYGTAFPDTSKPHPIPETISQTQYHPNLMLDQSDLGPDLEAQIFRILKHHQGNADIEGSPATHRAVKEVLDSYFSDIHLSFVLKNDIENQELTRIELTERQFDCLNYLRNNSRANIQGCAGSGKTLLALEKARQHSKLKEKTLLTSHNASLCHYLYQQVRRTQNDFKLAYIDVLSLEQLAQINLQCTKKSIQDISIAEQLKTASEHLQEKYDCIIVDEGQDLDPIEWLALQSFLNDPENGVFYNFYDDNQHLKSHTFQLPFAKEPIPLHRNVRNTRQIFSFCHAFYQGHKVEGFGPVSNYQVELLSYQSGDQADFDSKLRGEVRRLMKHEGVKPSQIQILSAAPLKKSMVHSSHLLNRNLRPNLKQGINGIDHETQIYFESVSAFKGLEAEVVILTDIEQAEKFIESVYVGTSRARSFLLILTTAEGQAKLDHHLKAGQDVISQYSIRK